MPNSWSKADLASALAAARTAWPTLSVNETAFATFGSRLDLPVAEIPANILQDLYLACACAQNVPGALALFREHLFPVVSASAKRFDTSSNFVDEVYQRLSEVLFVGGAAGPAKIFRYTGQGTLAGFVATTAKRIALRLATNAARFQGESALIDQFTEVHEQETTMLKQQHRDTFNRALSIALRQLSSRERIILRMNLIERVSTSRIATMYKVSQPTVSRWIQRSARAIFATVKDLVCDELEIDTRELESLLLLVRSQIEITISHAVGNSTVSSRQG